MHQILRLLILIAIALGATSTASAHGTASQPGSPGDLTTASIVQRMKQMGYRDIQVLGEDASGVDLQMRDESGTYLFHASRKMIGSDTLTSQDAEARVRRARRPASASSAPSA